MAGTEGEDSDAGWTDTQRRAADLMIRKPPVGVRVAITRYVGTDGSRDGHHVECQLVDVSRRRTYKLVVPAALVTAVPLDAGSAYPLPGVLGCEVVGDGSDGTGLEWIAIFTKRPHDVMSLERLNRFSVPADEVVELT